MRKNLCFFLNMRQLVHKISHSLPLLFIFFVLLVSQLVSA